MVAYKGTWSLLQEWVHDPFILGNDPIFEGSWRLQVLDRKCFVGSASPKQPPTPFATSPKSTALGLPSLVRFRLEVRSVDFNGFGSKVSYVFRSLFFRTRGGVRLRTGTRGSCVSPDRTLGILEILIFRPKPIEADCKERFRDAATGRSGRAGS